MQGRHRPGQEEAQANHSPRLQECQLMQQGNAPIHGLAQDYGNSSALAMPQANHSPRLQECQLMQQGNAPIHGLAQDCGNSSELAMELLQSCAKPQKYTTDTS